MSDPIIETINKFMGLKTDEDAKQIPSNAFTIATNYVWDDASLLGLKKRLMPLYKKELYSIGVSHVDEYYKTLGITNYNYIDNSGVLQSVIVFVVGIKYWSVASSAFKYRMLFYKMTLDFATITLLSTVDSIYQTSFVLPNKVSFAIYQNKLFIGNAVEYPYVYDGAYGTFSQMGAPAPIADLTEGNNYAWWVMTYVTAGGEEVIGSISNYIRPSNYSDSSHAPNTVLRLPLGYNGTLSRKIYRTKGSTFGTYYLVDTIADNTTLTYTDTKADTALGSALAIATNNELPKSQFLVVANNCLYGAKNSKYPTQLMKTDTGIEVFDAGNYIEVSNSNNDETPIEGIGVDFGKVIVGTGKNLYFVEPSDVVAGVDTVKPTRANIGIKDGWSVKNIPSFATFNGGLAFVSTVNDVRIMSGNDDMPVTTTFSNVSTNNFSQNIKTSLDTALASYSYLCTEYFNYKYHLCIDGIAYVFDIRTMGWTKHDITATPYVPDPSGHPLATITLKSRPYLYAILNTGTVSAPVYDLYNVQTLILYYKSATGEYILDYNTPAVTYSGYSAGTSYSNLYKEYSGVKYYALNASNSYEVPSYLTSGYISVDRLYRFLEKVVFWTKSSIAGNISISLVTDDNTGTGQPKTATITYTDATSLNYKILNVGRFCKWFYYSITGAVGNHELKQLQIIWQGIKNKETL